VTGLGADAAHDIVAIEQLVRRSAALNDGREWAALASLYSVTGRLRRPNGDEVSGRDAIEASYAAAPATRRTRHLCGGSVVETDSAGAVAVTPVLLFTWDAATDGSVAQATGPAIGDFTDVLVRTEHGWRIAERIATVTARVPTVGG
jgi:hypothetical protein